MLLLYGTITEIDSDFNNQNIKYYTKTIATYSGLSKDFIPQGLKELEKMGILKITEEKENGKFKGKRLIFTPENVNNLPRKTVHGNHGNGEPLNGYIDTLEDSIYIEDSKIKENKNPPKAEYQKNSENKEKSEIQNNSVSKIAMSSVEKNSIKKITKKLDLKQIEFFKVYQNQFKFTCSEKTKAVVEGVPRIMNLYNKYYGKDYLSKFKQSVADIASDKYWRKVFSDNPLRVAPKNFFNQTFIENYLIGRVNKIKKNQNGQLHKTVLSEERRKQIDADNNRELSKLG